MENRIKSIKATFEQVAERPDTKEFNASVHWKVTLGNCKPFYFSEGLGRFMNFDYTRTPKDQAGFDKKCMDVLNGKEPTNALVNCWKFLAKKDIFKKERIKDSIRASNCATSGGYLRHVIKEIKPPKIEDILYSLTMDADAIQYEFSDWCDSIGYDTDSIKAKATFDACRDNAVKLMQLGFGIDELQTHFEDY